MTSMALLDGCSIQLEACGNPVALANSQNFREPAGERRAVLQLGRQRAVQADATRHLRQRLVSMGPVVHEVVRRAVDPPGVPTSEEATDLLAVEGEHPAQIPAGQRENPWLQCVEHREQQVRLFDLLHLFWCELGDAGDSQRSGDDCGGCRGDAVLVKVALYGAASPVR